MQPKHRAKLRAEREARERTRGEAQAASTMSAAESLRKRKERDGDGGASGDEQEDKPMCVVCGKWGARSAQQECKHCVLCSTCAFDVYEKVRNRCQLVGEPSQAGAFLKASLRVLSGEALPGLPDGDAVPPRGEGRHLHRDLLRETMRRCSQICRGNGGRLGQERQRRRGGAPAHLLASRAWAEGTLVLCSAEGLRGTGAAMRLTYQVGCQGQ